MPRKYLDTSALVKLYVPEPLSALVQAEIVVSDLVISQLGVLEFRSAIYGMVRQGRQTLAGAQAAIGTFVADLGNFEVLSLPPGVYSEAERLLDTHAVAPGLRPADALQLAVAIDAHRKTPLDALVTTDAIMRSVAIAEGLVVAP